MKLSCVIVVILPFAFGGTVDKRYLMSACVDDSTCPGLLHTFQLNGQDICSLDTFKTYCQRTCRLCPEFITTTPKSVCSIRPCVHGTCNELPTGAFECTCNSGYHGFLCDQACMDDPKCPVLLQTLQQTGQDVCTEDSFKVFCNKTCGLCTVLTTTTPTTPSTPLDACVPSPCVNGVCQTASNGSAVCTCNPGYIGDHCNNPDPCLTLSPCSNGGTCIPSPTGSFRCVCTLGHTGILCDQTVNPCSTKPCLHGTCTIQGAAYTCNCNQGYARKNCDKEIHDCKDIQDENIPRTHDDMYLVLLDGNLVNIKCDMKTQGGGWTVLMNRQDGSTNFVNQDYSAYASGFGPLDGNFWTGLEKMNALTGDGRRYQLRVELTTTNGSTYFETYDDFSVGPPKDFVLHVGQHNGNAGDSLSGHNGFGFTTKDVDHDRNPGTNCGVYLHGAWWFHHCYDSCLTCPYITPGTTNCKSFSWNSLGFCMALKAARMLVRPM